MGDDWIIIVITGIALATVECLGSIATVGRLPQMTQDCRNRSLGRGGVLAVERVLIDADR